jgi:uncharacterized protein
MAAHGMRIAQLFSALGSGILFGLGLVISGMVNPAKVIGFLDVAGDWDPTLAFVMGGALLVATPAFRWILRRPHPMLGTAFSLPTKAEIEPRLIGGAALFGVGWGLVGLCPGPAITALVSGVPLVALFVVAMVAGAWLHNRLTRRAGA